jgi:WhiB family redox-sensing transcriptional regulator
MNRGNSVNSDDFFEETAASLDWFEQVPGDVLHDVVMRDGTCIMLFRLELEPEWSGDELTDREAAARICADCPVQSECLELELRTSGGQSLGVWGALPAEDLRALYPVWRSRRQRRSGLSDELGGPA